MDNETGLALAITAVLGPLMNGLIRKGIFTRLEVLDAVVTGAEMCRGRPDIPEEVTTTLFGALYQLLEEEE